MEATNPTPAERAALERRIAEGVMGWTIYTDPAPYFTDWWTDGNGQMQHDMSWSPHDKSADALMLLERIQYLEQTEDGNLPPIFIRQEWNDAGECWAVAIGDWDFVMFAGPHFGPAVCLLAEKVLNQQKETTNP